MLSVNETLQKLGNPGFETLSLLWLESRLEFSLLKRALKNLRLRHPILTARISKRWGGLRHWQWEADEEIPLYEQTLPSSEESAVLEAAAVILSRRRDLKRDPSVAFHLLHLPDDSDVLLMHSNHALIDHSSGTLLLQELNRLCCGETIPPSGSVQDRIQEYRSRFPRRQRLRAFLRTVPDLIRDRWVSRKRSPRVLPARELSAEQQPARLKIVSRQLTTQDVERLQQHSRQFSRLPSPSMTILASVVQAFSQRIPNPRPDDLFRTGIGVEIAPQQSAAFHPQNTSSVLRLQLSRAELGANIPPVELLHNRLLKGLKDQRDLGIVETSSLFSRCYPLIRRFSGRMIRRAFSFWYAYFSVPDDLSRHFAGIPLRQVCYLGPAWSPPGLTLLVTRFQDRLYLTLTYVAQLVKQEQAEEFLDAILKDLRSAMRDPAPGHAAEPGKSDCGDQP